MKTFNLSSLIILSLILTNVHCWRYNNNNNNRFSNFFSRKGRPEIPNDFFSNPIHRQSRLFPGPIPENHQIPQINKPNIMTPEIPEYNFKFQKGFHSFHNNGQSLIDRHKQLFGINQPNMKLNNNIHRGKGINPPNYIPNNNIHKGNGYTPQFIDISQQNPGHQWLNNAGFPILSNSKGFPSKGFPSKGKGYRPTYGPNTIQPTITQQTRYPTLLPSMIPTNIPTISPIIINNECTNKFDGKYMYKNVNSVDDQYNMDICKDDSVNGGNKFFIGLSEANGNNIIPFGIARGETVNVTGNFTYFKLNVVETQSQIGSAQRPCYRMSEWIIECKLDVNEVEYKIISSYGIADPNFILETRGPTTSESCWKPVSEITTLTKPYLLKSSQLPGHGITHIHNPPDPNTSCFRMYNITNLPDFKCIAINPIIDIFDNTVRVACCNDQDSGSLFTVMDNSLNNVKVRGMVDIYRDQNGIPVRSTDTSLYDTTAPTTDTCSVLLA